MVGSTAARPVLCSMQDGSRKKFCMSTITSAESAGEMLIDVDFGPSLVGIVNCLEDSWERS